MKLDREKIGSKVALVYRLDNDDAVLLGLILANHSMTINDALDLCGVDMDEDVVRRLGWDGWEPSAIDLVSGDDRYDLNIVDSIVEDALC